MQIDLSNPLSDASVCKALLSQGVLSRDQAKRILGRKEILKKRLTDRLGRKEGGNGSPHCGGSGPLDIIALLTARDLERSGDACICLDEEVVYKALAAQWKIPYRKIDPLKLDLNLVTTTIPRSFARKHLVLPIEIQKDTLIVATCNPFNLEAMDDIARVRNLRISPVVTPRADIIKIINEFFGFKRSIIAAENQFSSPLVDLGNLEQYVRLKSVEELPSNDQHIVNAVNHLLLYAFDQRASDIHIEPKRDTTLVRMRIDGVLHTVYELPKKVHFAIVSRIKNMSRLDMAEKRRPQDGRIKTDKGGEELEIRVSTVPVAFGEKVVMRIMDPDVLFQDLDRLGFSPADIERYGKIIGKPHGIVLVCGPTGSGKSTTLYSTLRKLSTPEINITTVEDPIEMVHEDFNQIAVQPAVNITFSSILRNILRQDPDIIMIGEMRDLETAENAVQAAMTGHLVLSTIHTNDAASAITRMIDLGIPSFLIQATGVGIVAQRLVRKVCEKCAESYAVGAEKLHRMGLAVAQKPMAEVTLRRGKGCQRCRGTGYFGRTAVHEVIPYTDAIRRLTTPEADAHAIAAEAVREGMVSMRESAIQKMLAGVTTVEEVLRVTWEKV